MLAFFFLYFLLLITSNRFGHTVKIVKSYINGNHHSVFRQIFIINREVIYWFLHMGAEWNCVIDGRKICQFGLCLKWCSWTGELNFCWFKNFTFINRLICNKGRIFPCNTFLLTVNLKWQSTLTVFEFKLNSFLLVIVLFKSHIMTGIICCFLSISYKLIFKQVKEHVFSGSYSLEEMFFAWIYYYSSQRFHFTSKARLIAYAHRN